MESLIHDRQKEYYSALMISDSQGESTAFIQFMLGIIREALTEIRQTEEAVPEEPDLSGNLTGSFLPDKWTDTERQILRLLRDDSALTQEELAKVVGKSPRTVRGCIRHLREAGALRREGARKNGIWIVADQ